MRRPWLDLNADLMMSLARFSWLLLIYLLRSLLLVVLIIYLLNEPCCDLLSMRPDPAVYNGGFKF